MDYEKLFGYQSKEDGLRTYFLFETFILRLLAHDLKLQGKNLDPHNAVLVGKIVTSFDAIAPNGIDDLPGPTIIELKFTRHGSVNIRKLAEMVSNICSHGQIANMRSLLIIYGGIILTDLRRKTLHDEILRTTNPAHARQIPLKIWDDSDIKTLIDKHPDIAEKIIEGLAVERLEDLPQIIAVKGGGGGTEGWKSKSENHIRSVQAAYNNNELSLFLGAGVSKDAGMPDWPSLLDALLVVLFTKKLSSTKEISNADLDYLVRQYRQIDDASPLLNARYVRRGLSENTIGQTEEFLTALTEALYRLSNPEKSAGSPLLKQLARMCVPRRTGSKIRAVTTYNFDDLLEKHLVEKQVDHKPIYHEGDVPTKDELPIYHVHGFLPRNRAPYEGLDKSTLVFSEEGYHTIFADPFHWSNLVQLSQLREAVCLMVGLSMTDPNIRRLLEITARRNDAVRHFALMRRISKKEFLQKADPPSDKSKESIEEFLLVHHSIKEALFSELGVSIIWFEDYSHLPEILANIQKPPAE